MISQKETIGLILNGLTFDKALFNETLHSIADDGHLNCITRRAKLINYKYRINNIFGRTYSFLKLIKNVSELIFCGNLLSLLDIPEDSMKLLDTMKPNYEGYDLKNKNNFSFIKLFLSNLSDTQTLIPAPYLFQNIEKIGIKRVMQTFCARPYYDNKYIDSIEISINKGNNNSINKENLIKLITCYIDNIVNSDIIIDSLSELVEKGQVDQITMERIKTVFGRSVFGIDFFSWLLFKLFGNDTISFEFSNDLINNNRLKEESKKDGKDGIFIAELIMLAGNPGKINFNIVGKATSGNIVRLHGINRGRSKSKFNYKFNFKSILPNYKWNQIIEHYFKLEDLSNFIKIIIPIKKIISVPETHKSEIKTISIDEIPVEYSKIYPISKCFEDYNVKIFSIGGAEHNLPLVHLVNSLRHKGHRQFGFLDNVFDRSKISPELHHDFLMDTSNYVCGLNAIPRARYSRDHQLEAIDTEDHSNQAEILRIDLDDDHDIEVYSIYGFSAPMTRYAFLGLLYALDKNNEHYFIENLEINKHKRREYCYFSGKQVKLYILGATDELIKKNNNFKGKETFKNLRNKFDQIDVLNNTIIYEKGFKINDKIKSLIIENLYVIP